MAVGIDKLMIFDGQLIILWNKIFLGFWEG